MQTYEIVCGDLGRDLVIPIRDSDGVPVTLVSPDVTLRATSMDLPGVVVTLEGAADIPDGDARFYQVGGSLTSTQLGAKPQATFVGRIRAQDADGVIHTGEIALKFVRLHPAVEDLEGDGAMPTPLMMSHDVRSFAYEVNTVGSGTSGIPRGVRRGTWAERCRGIARDVISNDTVTANKVFEVCEDFLVSYDEGGSYPWWNRPWAYAMVQNSTVVPASAGLIAGECLQGIEMGSFMIHTPWATNYVNSPIPMPVCQLRFNWTRGKWEVLVWCGDTATAPEVVDCDYQPVDGIWACDTDMKELKMVYLPKAAGGSRLLAYLNGELVKDHSSPQLDLCYGQIGGGSARDIRAGYFVTAGSNPLAEITESTFYSSRIWQKFRYPTPPNRARSGH